MAKRQRTLQKHYFRSTYDQVLYENEQWEKEGTIRFANIVFIFKACNFGSNEGSKSLEAVRKL